MLEKYMDDQPIVTKLLLNSFNNNKLVQAYLLISNDKSFLLDYSISFSKKLITPNYDSNICNMIDNNSYPELKIINPVNNVIKKEQLLELQQSFQVKPTLGEKLVYIINGADLLHSSSANTILKFLEEPNDNIVAILLTDNVSKVLPTIKSRCQNLVFNNKKQVDENKLDSLFLYYKTNIDDSETSKDDFNYLLDKTIDFITQIDKIKIKEFIHFKDSIFDVFKTKDYFIIMFNFMLYFYYDSLNYTLSRELVYMNKYQNQICEFTNNNKIEELIEKLKIIEETKLKLDTNMNLKMLMDDFIIKYSEV
ncbi:MAG: hypothetical protein IIZ40_00290 [Bacilli bacterium]|nr:hypothetical protein [Bacilli bacterium]